MMRLPRMIERMTNPSWQLITLLPSTVITLPTRFFTSNVAQMSDPDQVGLISSTA